MSLGLIDLSLFMRNFELFSINNRNTNIRMLRGIDVKINELNEKILINKNIIQKFNKLLL